MVSFAQKARDSMKYHKSSRAFNYVWGILISCYLLIYFCFHILLFRYRKGKLAYLLEWIEREKKKNPELLMKHFNTFNNFFRLNYEKMFENGCIDYWWKSQSENFILKTFWLDFQQSYVQMLLNIGSWHLWCHRYQNCSVSVRSKIMSVLFTFNKINSNFHEKKLIYYTG